MENVRPVRIGQVGVHGGQERLFFSLWIRLGKFQELYEHVSTGPHRCASLRLTDPHYFEYIAIKSLKRGCSRNGSQNQN